MSKPSINLTASNARIPWQDSAVACLTIYLGLSAILLVLILRRNQGHFSYTLDDPYIHLALAERLSRGLYGINLGEPVSPSSSILWPFLLIPGVGTVWHPYLPLVLNLIFGCILAWMIGSIARGFVWPRSGRFRTLRCWTLGLLLVLAANLPGLTFTGMEHILQGITAVACAYAVILAFHTETIPGWCIALVILAPAIRYESYVLAVALACALMAHRRWVATVATLTLSLAIPVAFALFLMKHGLEPLPNSILAKGMAFGASPHVALNLLHTMRDNSGAYLTKPKRWPTTFLLPLMLVMLWWVRRDRLQRIVLAGAALAVLLQMLAGSYSWYHRYEVYTKIFAILILLAVVGTLRPRVPFYVVATFILFADLPYVSALKTTPLAAENIYQQQYQMHRFVQEYGGNFAANDIGWVSYRLPPSTYMLDLFGLASSEALHQTNRNAVWLDDVTRRHQVGLVVIYPTWFPDIPPDWTPVGRLTLGVPVMTATASDVYFYETPYGTEQDRHRLSRILPTFAQTLPPGVSFTLHPTPPNSSLLPKRTLLPLN